MLNIFLITFTPFYFVHYSDPQIGRNAYTIPYCSLAVNQISQMRPAPNFIIVCGDMANDPTNQTTVMSQWRICDSLFDLLPMPKYYSSGNNDLGYANEACWTPSQLALYRGFWGPDYYSLDRDSCHFVCLNSTMLDTYSGHACYPYSLEQDSFLVGDLAGIAAGEYRHVFLFFHFPLYVSSPTEANSGSNVDRPRRDTLLQDLVKYGFTSVITGHLHSDLMNLYGPSLLESGLATCETSIGSCGYRPFKVFKDGVETYAVWLSAPVDTVPMVQIVTPEVTPDTIQPGDTVAYTCLVDSAQFPDWRGLTYQWQFGDGQTSSSANASHIYADTGHFQVVFVAYKIPHLAALYHYRIVVRTSQQVVESINHNINSPLVRIIPNVVTQYFVYELAESHPVKIDLYQPDGRLVMNRDLGVQFKGRHTFIFNRTLAKGVYFVRITVTDQIATSKLVVVK